MTKRETAVVLGNGRSRLEFDLDEIKNHAFTIGCNAIYRDWTPDVLVATDVQISAEVVKSGYTIHNDCYFRHWDMRVPTTHKEMVLGAFNKDNTSVVDFSGDEPEVVITGLSAIDSDCNALPYAVVYAVGVPSGDKSKDLNTIECDMPNKETMEFVGPNAVDAACQMGYKRVVLLGFDLASQKKINNIYAGSDHYRQADDEENEKMPQSAMEMARVFRENPNVEFVDINSHDRPLMWENTANYRNVICLQTKFLIPLLTSDVSSPIIRA
jgi:hypothetical protein